MNRPVELLTQHGSLLPQSKKFEREGEGKRRSCSLFYNLISTETYHTSAACHESLTWVLWGQGGGKKMWLVGRGGNRRSLGSSWSLVTLLLKATRQRDHQRPLSTSFLFPFFPCVLSSPPCLPSCPIVVTTSHAAGLCEATRVRDSLNAALVPGELAGMMRQPGKRTPSLCAIVLCPMAGQTRCPGGSQEEAGDSRWM